MPQMADTQAQLLLCNCPNNETASKIAHLLVEQKLAACVNCLPGVRSVYQWNNTIEEASEVMLLIKTTTARYKKVEQTIVTAHPYEVPEVIAVDISNGLPAYLQWIGASV